MAEFAAAALATVAESAGLAGATAGEFGVAISSSALGDAVAGIAGSTSTVASILGGTATVASVLAAQRAGEEKAKSLELAAGDAESDSALEVNRGTERRTGLRKQLLVALGERDVATAASGVDLSFGTPAVARQEATKESERALSVDQQTEELRRARLAERAGSYRRMAEEARTGGLAKAAGLALAGGANLNRRYG